MGASHLRKPVVLRSMAPCLFLIVMCSSVNNNNNNTGKVCTPVRDIYLLRLLYVLVLFGCSRDYSYIMGLYCGLGLYWVDLSFILLTY